ncbi:MAG: hypothetical protein R3C98_16005 [Hyphomonas sp.]
MRISTLQARRISCCKKSILKPSILKNPSKWSGCSGSYVAKAKRVKFRAKEFEEETAPPRLIGYQVSDFHDLISANCFVDTSLNDVLNRTIKITFEKQKTRRSSSNSGRRDYGSGVIGVKAHFWIVIS